MLIEERRQHILVAAQRERRVYVRHLAQTFGVSRITIRKDLQHLQMEGLLQRSHGGALPVQPGTLFDPALTEKERSHPSKNNRIAKAAADMVREG